jgi:hypothetical protein
MNLHVIEEENLNLAVSEEPNNKLQDNETVRQTRL